MGIWVYTSPVKAQAHVDALGIDVVAPQQLETLADLGQVGVRVGVGADELVCAIPDAV